MSFGSDTAVSAVDWIGEGDEDGSGAKAITGVVIVVVVGVVFGVVVGVVVATSESLDWLKVNIDKMKGKAGSLKGYRHGTRSLSADLPIR